MSAGRSATGDSLSDQLTIGAPVRFGTETLDESPQATSFREDAASGGI